MGLFFVLLFIFIAATLITFLFLWYPTRKSELLSRRLGTGEEQIRADLELKKEILGKTSSRKQTSVTSGEGALSRLGRLSRKNENFDSKIRQSLVRAGYTRENNLRVFLSLKMICAAILPLISCSLLWMLLDYTATPLFLTGMFTALLGYRLPDYLLKKKIGRRQEEIARGLPDALDFLVICMEAGMGLNAALIKVGQELKLRFKALGEELLHVNKEMRAGVSREHALRNLSERTQVEDLNIVAGSLILADKLGSSIADTLRAQSESLRIRVRQRAEEQAAKSSLKMLFPLIFLILPALFVVILGPGIILVMKALLPILP